MTSTDDWGPAPKATAAPVNDWAAPAAHATAAPNEDWATAGPDAMAQTWAKQYKVEPVPDIATPQMGALIDKYAKKYGVDNRFSKIIAGIESAGGRDTGASSAGAYGPYQLMPATFKALGGKDINDPEQNIDAGNRYLAQLLKRFNGDKYKAAMAYNMGPNGLEEALSKGYGEVPEETRRYAGRLYLALQQAPTTVPTANAPETKLATAAAAHPPQQAGVGTAALNTARQVAGSHGIFDNAVRWLKNQQHEAAQDPMGAVDAVLGAPQRYVEGSINQGHRERIPNPFTDFAHGIDVMVHPRNQQMQERELNELVDTLHLPHAQGKDLGSRLINFGSHFSAQMGTDPLNVFPVGELIQKTKYGAQIAKTLDRVVESAKSIGAKIPGVQQAANGVRALSRTALAQGVRQLEEAGRQFFGRRPELDKYLDAPGKGARLSIEQKQRTLEAVQQAEDEELLKAHEDELRKLRPGAPLPEAIRQRYLQEPWRYGNAEMRAEAERLGYKPTFEDELKYSKPANFLNYNLREDYQTMIRPFQKTYEDLPIFRNVGGTHKEEFAGFEKARRAEGALPEDQFELTKNRLAIGRARVRQVATDNETAKYLDQYGGWKGTGPVDVSKLSHTPKRVAPDSPLRFATRIQKTAISFNPFPHALKNVGTLAYLKGGPEAFGRGLGYASKGLSESQTQRLMNMGLDAEYVRDIEGPLKSLADKFKQVEGAHQLSNKVMTRLELGYRQALLDQLDREMGPSELPSGAVDLAKEYKKADIIRQALGDYRNNSLFIAGLDAIGGPFVAFRMGIVPGAVGRALVKRPDRIEQVARGQQDFNNTVMGNSPSELQLGGPVEDAARMATDPWGYLTSPSSIGPVIGEGHRFLDPNRTATFGQIRDEAGRTFVPGYQLGEELGIPQHVLGGGYGPSPGVHPAASGLAAALGSYFQRRPSGKANAKFRRAEQRAQ